MTQEQKDLLIKDLCGRLPYGVKVEYNGEKYKISNVSICNETVTIYGERGYPMEVEIKKVKPYLFPLSSMTNEQCYKLASIRSDFQDCWKYIKTPIPLSICNFEQIDFFHKNHLDYRGLIPMGIANDATGLNIY